MHRLTLSSPESGRRELKWLVPDGLLKPHHTVFDELGVIALVVVGNHGALISQGGRQDLRPGDPVISRGGSSLVWHPQPHRPQIIDQEPTRGDPPGELSQPFEMQLEAKSIPLARDRLLLVGRHPACDLVVRDPRISSFHCAVTSHRGGVTIVDLESRNGTFVDGTRVLVASVAQRTVLRLGPVRANLRPTDEEERVLLRLPSTAMQRLYKMVDRVARSPAPVFIDGESGTGKEGVARSLHEQSGRKGRLVVINAATLTPELAASELFGHTKGAFTGAERDRAGAFELANQGTLFLDEIGELRLDVQTELLRVIEANQVRPLGSCETIAVDVRLVTATHRDLVTEVSCGKFRHDLFHRIWVLPLRIPPLRSRPRDIDALADGLLARQPRPRLLTGEARQALHRHNWPGNIRELINVLERACVLCDDRHLERKHIQIETSLVGSNTLDSTLHRNVMTAYAKNDRCVAATARELGIHRATVYRHLRYAQGHKYPPR